MSESNFREIQLNTKQVVFLFMAFVVAVVGVFLLGVQVGQGLKGEAAAPSATAADAVADGPAPTVLPPATSPKPFDYHDQLQAKGDAKSTPATPPNPAADAPPDPKPGTTPAAAAATPASRTSAPATSKEPAGKAVATKEPGGKTAASPAAIWFVQTGSYSSRSNADRQVAQLKSKGHPAILHIASTGNAKFKVRVGPLERSAADALRNRLVREGFADSAVIR